MESSNVKVVKACRICHSRKLYRFLDLTPMPIPNGFLKKEDLHKKEPYYELSCYLCENCGLVQLSNVVNPNIMFSNYVYIPSTSKIMMNNFSNLAYRANSLTKLDEKKLVIDIGSNDGSLLKFFKSYGAKVIGIDPAKNIAKLAEMNGIPTEVKLFNLNSAKAVVVKHGKASVITATNVIAHIDNLHQLFKGVSKLLTADGIFITEFPYLLDLIQKNEFDTIYHEHLSYFSLKPWLYLIEQYGFEIVEAQRLFIQGGSIRLIHKRKSKSKVSYKKTVNYLVKLEEELGLYDKGAFDKFSTRVANLRTEVIATLKKLKKKKKRIIGYGAAAKGNVLMHYFDINQNTFDYIVDSTSYKQGLYTPGNHIIVHPEQKLLTDKPDYAFILAWNFADEIIEKRRDFKRLGGKFIIPIPKLKIV